MNCNYLLILLLVIAIAIFLLFNCENLQDNFADTIFPEYMRQDNINKPCSMINFNRPSDINWKLFYMINRLRYHSILPFYRLSNSELPYPSSPSMTPRMTPVLIVPGVGDCVLKIPPFDQELPGGYSNFTKIWPVQNLNDLSELYNSTYVKDKTIEPNLYEEVKLNNVDTFLSFNEKDSNITPFIDALEALKYSNDILEVMPYDFRNISNSTVLTIMFKQIRQAIIRMYNYSNLPVLLVGHDLGCTLLSIFLSRQDENFKNTYIKELVCVGSVFGGSLTAINDYVYGIPEFKDYSEIVRQFDGIKLKIPNPIMFKDSPVFEYNNTMYKADELGTLLKYLKIPLDLSNIYNLQNESLKPPGVTTSFINNSNTQLIEKDLYDYWIPKKIIQIEKTSGKLFNDYDVILYLLNRLNINLEA